MDTVIVLLFGFILVNGEYVQFVLFALIVHLNVFPKGVIISSQNVTTQLSSTLENDTELESNASTTERISQTVLQPQVIPRTENVMHHNLSPQSNHKAGPQLSVQVYIVFFIGIMPATIGAFVWWVQSLNKKCSTSKQSGNNRSDSSTAFSEKSVSVEDIALRMPNLRSKLIDNNQHNLVYETYGNAKDFIHSRRVYSLEIPKNRLEMIEILGEGNFGQVWKAKPCYVNSRNNENYVAVKTNKINSTLEDQKEILKELDIMLQLGTHPNVVRLLGCCTENGMHFTINPH